MPDDGVSEFLVSAKAGQFLVVKSAAESDLSVQSPSRQQRTLSIGGGYEGSDNKPDLRRIYLLPETGQYRVLYAPAGGAVAREGSVEFSFLTKSDPAIDPGISPEEVSVEFGPFAPGQQFKVQPLSHFQEEGDDWPPHLAVQNHHFDFRIMSVAAYQKLFPEEKSVALLQDALRKGATAAKVSEFPYPRSDWWDGIIISARREILRGDGWSGFRWIGGFGGDEEYPSEGLGYSFNGITDDGRFLIVVRSDISHPDQKRFYPKRPVVQGPNGSYETSAPEEEKKMKARLEKSLDSAAPDSFTPSLDQLDSVVRSLKIRH